MGRDALDAAAGIDFPAGGARLRDLQPGRAQRKNVADVRADFGEAPGREVFAEPAGVQVACLGKGTGQRLVVFQGKQMHGLLRAAVGARVGMFVAGYAVAADHAAALQPLLGDGAAAALAGQKPDAAGEYVADDHGCHQFHSHAAPLTPDESPWRCFSRRVATWSEKMCLPHRFGTFR